jgi:hypothetical protein
VTALTDGQLLAFARDGFLVVPGVVPEPLLAAVDADIDRLLAEQPPPAGTTGSHLIFKRPERVPAIDALVHEGSPIPALARQLVAPHVVGHAFDYVQVVLNIPPHPTGPAPAHLDGHRPHQTHPDTFSVLAAVYLGDETAPGRGNVWVWPGSHRVHERLFAEHGTAVLLPVSGSASRLDPPVDIGEPVPVLAQRGDVLLSHFLLGHATGPNTTATVRRIAYLRLRCDGHADRWADTLTDAFTEFAPVRRALARR